MSMLKNVLMNESGATAIEYGLIAGGISVAIITVVGTLGSTLNGTFIPVAFFSRAWNRLVRTLAGSMRPWSWLQSFPSNFESQARHVIQGSLAAMAIVMLAVTTVLITVLIENRGIYQTASAPTASGVVAVRFVVKATAADIATFLETHKGIIVEVPRPGGFYRVRIFEPTASSLEELKKVAAHMAQDPVVELIAVPQ
jgi:pilus assembly protein Flp/PilA